MTIMATAPETTAARRIFVRITDRHAAYEYAWDSPDRVIQAALDLVRKQQDLIPRAAAAAAAAAPLLLLLAKERTPSRVDIIFDVCNDAFDPERAHLPGEHNDLPVVAVFLGGGRGRAVGVGLVNTDTDTDIDSERAARADAGLEGRVNQAVRNHHDMNGVGSRPPFAVDHVSGGIPKYWSPRCLARKAGSRAL
ncbi:hypothetical protein GGR56DRAFT_636565 [Xylariaceae sp. FL0804]|nr:hypothetical protein GGR56DRAFT_636565 [Xylariaceae sp. FL0804]